MQKPKTVKRFVIPKTAGAASVHKTSHEKKPEKAFIVKSEVNVPHREASKPHTSQKAQNGNQHVVAKNGEVGAKHRSGENKQRNWPKGISKISLDIYQSRRSKQKRREFVDKRRRLERYESLFGKTDSDSEVESSKTNRQDETSISQDDFFSESSEISLNEVTIPELKVEAVTKTPLEKLWSECVQESKTSKPLAPPQASSKEQSKPNKSICTRLALDTDELSSKKPGQHNRTVRFADDPSETKANNKSNIQVETKPINSIGNRLVWRKPNKPTEEILTREYVLGLKKKKNTRKRLLRKVELGEKAREHHKHNLKLLEQLEQKFSRQTQHATLIKNDDKRIN